MRLVMLLTIIGLAACGAVEAQKTGAASQTAGSEAPAGVRRVTAGVMSKQLMERKDAVYPPMAKAMGVTGTVMLRAVIAKTGHVETLTAVSGPPLLRQAALDAVRSWIYKPYLLNGEPTPVETMVSVNFSFAGQPQGSPTGPAVRSQDQPSMPDGSQTVVVPSSTASSSSAIRISGGVLQGLLEKKVEPVYPVTDQSGSVVLKVRVNTEGEVQDVTVVSGPESLRAASVDAVSKWGYRPYLLNGTAVDVDSTVTVTFSRRQ